MGNILVARAWRIASIISPVATFASSTASNGSKDDPIALARVKVMDCLSMFSLYGGGMLGLLLAVGGHKER
jgi:hypothetical protein